MKEAEGAESAADVDDAGVLGAFEQRQERVDDTDVPDDVGHHDGCDVVRDVVVDAAERAGDAGVVDQHVQMPVGPFDDLRGVADGLIRGHVHLEEGRARGARSGLSELGVASGEVDAVARPSQPPHRFQADAPVGPGDQRDESTRGRRVRFLLFLSHTLTLMRDWRNGVAQSVPLSAGCTGGRTPSPPLPGPAAQAARDLLAALVCRRRQGGTVRATQLPSAELTMES